MLRLKRSYLDNCTIGKLFYRDEFVCYTVERPWLNNKKGESCIPEGEYDLNRYDSSKFHDCLSLTCHDLGVGLTSEYHRNYILIHPGNFPGDVEGCIAPGLFLHPVKWGVASSRDAMEKLKILIHNQNIKKLKIEG